MHDRHPVRHVVGLIGFGLIIAWGVAGCGSGSGSTTTVQVSPEAQKKTEAYLQNYQKQMLDQHKNKGAAKKTR